MKSRKYLCCGFMIFNLPDNFNGTRSDALRLVADYIDETEGKEEITEIDINKAYKEIINDAAEEMINDKEHKLRMIDLHIEEVEKNEN